MEEINNRRSIRKYKPDQVSKELLEQLLEAARVAPSGKNKQPWKYVIYKNHAKDCLLDAMEEGLNRTKLELSSESNTNAGLADAYNTLRIMREAPVTIMVLNPYSESPYKAITSEERVSEIIDSLSIGASVQNLLLKACELNLGTLWIGNTFFAYPELEAYMRTDMQITGAIAVGYPNENPVARPRKTMDMIVEYHIEE